MRPRTPAPLFPTPPVQKALLLALAGSLLAALPALALAPANANFASERGVPFSLVLDGRPLTCGVARQVHVAQLVPGQHWADFSIPTSYGGAVHFRSRVWLEPGLETTFVLIARPARPPVLRQAGAVALVVPGCPAPDCGNGGPHDPYNPYNGRYDDRDNGYYGGPGYGAPSGYNGPAGYSNGNGSGSAPGYGPGPGPGAGYYPGSAVSSYRQLAPADVDALVQAVRQRPFEASRLSIAKEALRESSLQAIDLQRLLRSLDFEASRVELAKYAYEHVADRQNFYRVYEAFDFESSVREVQQAVAR